MSTEQAKQKQTKFKVLEFPTPGFDYWFGGIKHFCDKNNMLFPINYNWNDIHPWKVVFLQGCFDTEAIMIAQGRKVMRANKRRKFSHDQWLQAVYDFVEYYKVGDKNYFDSFFGIELYEIGLSPLTAIQIHMGWLRLEVDDE